MSDTSRLKVICWSRTGSHCGNPCHTLLKFYTSSKRIGEDLSGRESIKVFCIQL